MSSVQWSLSAKPIYPPEEALFVSEDVSLTPRVMMDIGGLICSFGVWELLIWPFFIARLPLLGLLELPFVLMGLICLAIMPGASAYALLAQRSVLWVDQENLRKELHLFGGLVLTKRFPVDQLMHIYAEESMDSEATHPWRILVNMRGQRHPLELESFGAEATARRKLDEWRTVIAKTTGYNLPT